MIVTTVTWGIKKISAIPRCDDSKIPFPQTNKSTTVVIGIDIHIRFLLVKYSISIDKIGGIKNIMMDNTSPYCIKKSVITSPNQI